MEVVIKNTEMFNHNENKIKNFERRIDLMIDEIENGTRDSRKNTYSTTKSQYS